MLQIESLNFQMLNAGLSKHNGDWNWQNVSSPFSRIYLCTEGQAWLHTAKQTVELRPHHLYLVPAYVLHSYECHGLFTHYYIHIYEGFKKETDIFEYYDFPMEVEACHLDERLFETICNSHPETKLPESNPKAYDNMSKTFDYVNRYNKLPLYQKMELRGDILILFSRFVKLAKPKLWTEDIRLTSALRYIHDNIYSEIKTDKLASVACLTKSYFIRLFSKAIGMPPIQYVNNKKVQHAQLLLLTDNKPVKEIAYSLGFSDISYFIRLFRKVTGTTPLAYRATMR